MNSFVRVCTVALAISFSAIPSFSAIVESSTNATSDDHDTFNLRVEPHWLALKELALDFQVSLGEKWSIGPTFAYTSNLNQLRIGSKVSNKLFYDEDFSRTALGLRAVHYFKSNQQSSAYISVFGKYIDAEIEASGDSLVTIDSDEENYKGEFTEVAYGLTGGYQWKWGSTITMNLGGGIESYSSPDKIELKSEDSDKELTYRVDESGIELAIDAGIGIAF